MDRMWDLRPSAAGAGGDWFLGGGVFLPVALGRGIDAMRD